MDYWFAECLPCKWETKHETEDAAIAAAEAHVLDQHRSTHPLVRASNGIGHVQNRTESVPPPAEPPKPPPAETGE